MNLFRIKASLVSHLLLFLLVSAEGGAAGLPGSLQAAEVPLEQWVVRHWSVDDGLPTSSLNRVLAAADGYIWSTSFSGLVRFDGQSFKVFGQRDVHALATSGFIGLSSGRDGRLWVGTQGDGPWWFDGRTLRPSDPGFSLRGEVVSLLEDAQGVIWVGLQEPAVLRIEGSRSQRLEDPALRDVLVRDIQQTKDGRIWFATRDNGLVSCASGGTEVSCRSFGRASGLPSDQVNAFAVDANGTIWAATEEGLGRLDGTRGSQIEELPGFRIAALTLGPDGHLWMATPKGLARWHPVFRDLEIREHGAGFPLHRVTALSFDHEGCLWLSSRLHGLFQLTTGRFSNYSVREGLASERIHAAHDPGGGEIWVGTDVGRIQRIESGEIGEVPLETDLGGAQVMDFHRDSRGRLWLSTYAGLLRRDGREERLFGIGDGLPSREVRWAREDRKGRLWAGTRGGVVRLGEEGRFVTEEPWREALDGISFSFDEASDGRLFFGTRTGLVILEPGGEVEVLRNGERLPGSLVFGTHIDTEGVVWICTNGGLARFARGEVAVLRESDGLPVPSIYDLAEDSLGYFWMTSAKGILRVSRAGLQEFFDGAVDSAPRIDLLGVQDGLHTAENTGARKILLAGDGRLWFPTLGGISSIDPASLSVNSKPPPVRIIDVVADGEPLDPREGLVIPAGTRRLSFGFTALSYRFPSRVRVLYRLEGFDSDWMEAKPGHREAGRRATYTNLSPGSYELRVIAANNDDVWNEEGARLGFRIAPELHQTRWFRGLAVVLLGLTIGGVHFWRVRTMGARNRVLEQAAGERRRFIEQLAEKNRELELFASTVSHDLKGPLVTIEGFLGLLERDLESGNRKRAERDMSRIRQGVRAMSRLIEGLLEVSRIGRGEESMERVATVDLAQRAVELLAAQITAARVRVEVAEDLPDVFGNPQQLLQVFQNLVANGVKFMGDQPQPWVEIGHRRQGSETVFFVRDNGAGIDPSQHSKIFGLFDRLDPEIEGSGLGLAIVQRVVEAHGGRVWVESDGVGHGSCFCFTLRLV